MKVVSDDRLLCCWIISLAVTTLATQVFTVPWDTASFGPDGPWQAVKITLGGNDNTKYLDAQNVTEVSVYPGGTYSSNTFTKAACEEYPDSLCGAGGTWDPDPDQLKDQQIQFRPAWKIEEAGLDVPSLWHIALGLTINGKTVWNASLATCNTGTITYPSGNVGGLTLGQLSLGATEQTTQNFSRGDETSDAIIVPMFSGQLYNDKEIPSYSYGLHIGSAAFNYSGSLTFGGYDKGRVIGPVTSFTDEKSVDLLDIGIGVEFGASPFTFDKKENLLSTKATKATLNPLSPYLSLPRKTCDNIANLLPVTYDSNLKYYLWNVDDPLFTKIVSSPAYLSFTFPPSTGDRDNVVIKAPFALLNLTLEHPITDSKKQYFPCVPFENGPVLGHAFLQAAFLGRNWMSKTTWLAQAPGPGVARIGLGYNPLDIADSGKTIEGFEGEDYFNQSWAGHWSVIASQTTNQTKPTETKNPDPSPNGLSTGAKAGIGVGAGIGAIALVGLSIWIWRRRSVNQDSDTTLHARGEKSHNQTHLQEHNANLAPWGHELPEHVRVEPVEIPDTGVANIRG